MGHLSHSTEDALNKVGVVHDVDGVCCGEDVKSVAVVFDGIERLRHMMLAKAGLRTAECLRGLPAGQNLAGFYPLALSVGCHPKAGLGRLLFLL